jgi:hypothetical protein
MFLIFMSVMMMMMMMMMGHWIGLKVAIYVVDISSRLQVVFFEYIHVVVRLEVTTSQKSAERVFESRLFDEKQMSNFSLKYHVLVKQFVNFYHDKVLMIEFGNRSFH